MEDNFEWYKDGVKAVMKHAKAAAAPEQPDEARSDRALEGVVSLVADVLEPEDSAATAVEAALGESLQYIIVQNQQAGLAAISYLQSQSAGRSGFIRFPRSTTLGRHR
jgi:chromosome segregation protein